MQDQLQESARGGLGHFALRMSVLLVVAIIVLATACAISLSTQP